MQSYETVTEAVEGLRKEGYTEDFSLKENFIESKNGKYQILHNEFKVDKFFRFEGETDPADESIVYAISSEKYNLKGILVNAFGMYGDNIAGEMMDNLKVR